MPRTLGIDIHASVIRATYAKTSSRNVEILGYAEFSRTEHTREDLRTWLQTFDRAPDQVRTAVDGTHLSIRALSLPAGAAKRLDSVLPFELDEALPFPVAEGILDHQPILRTATALEVLTAVAPKAAVQSALDSARALGLEPSELAAGGAALDSLRHVIPGLAVEKACALLDISEDRTDIAILADGVCVFSRTIAAGLRALEQRANADSFAAQLRRSLAAYRMSGKPAIDRLLLSGVVAPHLATLAPWIEEVVAVQPEILELPTATRTESGSAWAVNSVDIAVDPASRARFAMSTALAVRGQSKGRRIDLRKGEFVPGERAGDNSAMLRRAAWVAIPIAVGFLFSIWARYHVVSSEHEALSDQLAQVTKETFDRETREVATARELLTTGRSTRDPLPHFTAWDALDLVSNSIPTDIVHNARRVEIQINDESGEGTLQLQGHVASLAERDTIAANIDEHECLYELTKGPTSPGPNNEGINYRIEAKIRCETEEEAESTENSEGANND